MAKNKADSSRYFRAQRNYKYETSTKDGRVAMSEADWKLKIIEEMNAAASAYKKCTVALIFHDSDRYTKEDQKKNGQHVAGTIKPLHVHFVITFGDNKKIELVMQKFGISDKRNVQMATKGDVFLSYRYLTHRTLGAMEDGKAAYNTSSVIFINWHIFDDDNVVDNSLSWDDAQKLAVYTKLCEGKVKKRNDAADLREIEKAMVGHICVSLVDGAIRADSARSLLIELYKKNVNANKIACAADDIEAMASQLYYSNVNKFNAASSDYRKAKASEMKKGDRNLKNGYISGAGGTGKSQLAKAMAFVLDDGRAPHMSAPDSGHTTYDPVGNYEGEKVSLFNEMEGSTLNMRSFCALFDEHQFVTFNSRNSDKNWIANYSIITESDDFTRWVDDKLRFNRGGHKYGTDLSLYKKDYYQVVRRFTYHIQLLKSGAHGCDAIVYKFDENSTAKMPFNPLNQRNYHCDDVRNIKNMVPMATAIAHDLGLATDSQLSKYAESAKIMAQLVDENASDSDDFSEVKYQRPLSEEEKSYLADPNNLF